MMIFRDNWETPAKLWNKLNEQYFFEIDVCASEENNKCLEYCSKETNFLTISKIGILNQVCWMNPPFSKAKEMFEHFFKVVTSGVAIYRCDNLKTKVWQDIILKNASWVFFFKGRINYEGFEGSSSRFPSALIGFNVEPPKNLKGELLMRVRW